MTLYALNFNDNNRTEQGRTGVPPSLVYILAERIMDQVEAAGKQQATPQIATDQRTVTEKNALVYRCVKM